MLDAPSGRKVHKECPALCVMPAGSFNLVKTTDAVPRAVRMPLLVGEA